MKFVRSPEQRQLLEQLTRARQRAGLTPADLADKVAASPRFSVKYQMGAHGPTAGPPRRR